MHIYHNNVFLYRAVTSRSLPQNFCLAARMEVGWLIKGGKLVVIVDQIMKWKGG